MIPSFSFSLLRLCLLALSLTSSCRGEESYYDPYINKDAPNGFSSIYERKIAYEYGEESDSFGKSVSVRGDLVLIGSCFSDYHGNQAGYAHIFQLDSGSEPTSTNGWTLVASLDANDTYPYDYFGWDVALGDGVAVVGAWMRDAPLQDAGSVYIFGENEGEWESTEILRGNYMSEYFGIKVALNWDSDILLVGAPGSPDSNGNTGAYGAVYVYQFHNNMWKERAVLRAKDGGSPYEFFGSSVAVDNNIGVIGAYGSNPGAGETTGAAYVISSEDNGKSWMVVQKLVASDSSQDAFFGRAVAIRNGTLAVGADGDFEKAISAGAVYVYRLGSSSGKWREKQKINVPATAEGYEMFGTSIAIWEDKMLIGSTGGNIEGSRTGSAWVYEFDGHYNEWTALVCVHASDGYASDKFGISVAMYGTTMAVGSQLGNGFDKNSGAVYVYTTVPPYVYYKDESLGTTAISALTIGAFIFSASLVLWAYRSGKFDTLLERDFFFGSLRQNPDFDVSRKGDFELAYEDSSHSSSSRAPLRA